MQISFTIKPKSTLTIAIFSDYIRILKINYSTYQYYGRIVFLKNLSDFQTLFIFLHLDNKY